MQNKGQNRKLQIRRAILSVANKEGIIELAKALSNAQVELIATGKTAAVLSSAGISTLPIEKISGSPESFQGRMKTISFPVCSGILYRRGDISDKADLERLGISPIDCVVVNFYPFKEALHRKGILRQELVEEVDIGGPTLVRSAAKNSPHVLVLTSPTQYPRVIQELKITGQINISTVEACAQEAWDEVLSYDASIARELGCHKKQNLRYGENPHQKGWVELGPQSPIGWQENLNSSLNSTSNSFGLSYNNILDLSAAYSLASDWVKIAPTYSGALIVKHGNPCGAALIPKTIAHSQKLAIIRAWEGDPISAFGGVVIFTEPLEEETGQWLAEKFIELIAAPQLSNITRALSFLLSKRKNLKAIPIHRWGEIPQELEVTIPGGRLFQTTDLEVEEQFQSVTRNPFPLEKIFLARFGVVICRVLKSNAVAIVREIPGKSGGVQLLGAGQGQPNRVEALKALAIPRTQAIFNQSGGSFKECVMVSDAFFPFRDTVDLARVVGIRWIVQPGGSVKDLESIAACDEFNMAMAFTGIRHLRH